MKPTLFVLAAGMGSRYGGLKQLDGLGPNGETIMDYSIFDAIRGGFGKVVFVIRKDFEADFRTKILSKYENHIPVKVVFQSVDDLPEGFVRPEGRTKPWGTNHAVLMGKAVIREPFAVINADDFYGRDGFRVLGQWLSKADGQNRYCMVGYRVGNTLSESGTVARGICRTDANNYLTGVVERTDIARVDGRRSYPWRIVAYAATATELPVNDMVWQTAEASRVADASWVRDGKIAWDWWNNWGVYGVDFKSGINTETYKYFIDFAAANGIEYVALDEGWGVRDGDVMHVVPEIDLPEIVSYAREKKVGIILWVVAKVLDDKLEEACRYYSELGVAGWKVDFIDRQDQAAVERVYRIADAAARYRMIVDFHGVYKPTGLQRTYPNVVNFEGIFGLEQLKWTDRTDADMPAYDCTFPFIRQVAGPVDYTQGAMRNASRKNFRAVNNHPMSQGTRAHQVATYVVFDSPLVMLCDSPTAYEKEPETLDYIVRFPTRFDQTLIPAGEIGRYIVTARRAGDRWYLGALTNWDAREVEVKLDFLGDGRWKARIFRDGVNADRYGEDYLLEERTVTAADSLAMAMAPGGGYAVQFERVQ